MKAPRRTQDGPTRPRATTFAAACAIAAIGAACVGCSSDGSGGDEPAVAGVAGSSAHARAAAAVAKTTENTARFPRPAAALRSLGSRLLTDRRSGQQLEVAYDQVVVRFAPEAFSELPAIAASLAKVGLTLVWADPDRGVGWVRGTAAALDAYMWHRDAVASVVGAGWDPVMSGAGKPESKDKKEKHAKKDKSAKKGHQHHDACGDAGDGPSMWHLASMSVGQAWNAQPTAEGVVVAVLDTGLSVDGGGAAAAPGLGTSAVLPGYDFVNLDDDPADDNGHGTLVSGALAATGGLPGVAPAVQLLPVKVLDAERRGSEAALVAGIDFAVAAGANVISMSLAFPTGFMPSGELARAVADAHAAGVVLVAATGNHGANEISYPAAFGEVVAVGASRLGKPAQPVSLECLESGGGESIAAKLVRAEYSGYGGPIDVCGPGGAMDRDLDQDGWPDAVAAYGFTPATIGDYEPFLLAGTSPASAAVAGASALLLAAGAAPADVPTLLRGAARSIGPAGFHISCGSGQVDLASGLERLVRGHVPAVPERFVNPVISLARDTAGGARAVAFVEVVDARNQPVPDVTVVGHFRGAVTHDVEAVTDDAGRVLMTSLVAAGRGALFEFSVDKIIEHGHGMGELVVVPKSFSRFELTSFQWMSSFLAEGAGVEPSPFTIAIDPDALLPWVGDFVFNMVRGADPSLPLLAPVSTVPYDLSSWTLVPTLVTRTMGGDLAPKVIALDRQAIVDDCGLSAALVPVYSVGAGVEPSPFRLDETLLRFPLTLSEVLVRPDALFLDGIEASETTLGLYFGDRGTVLIDVDGSTCEPRTISIADRDVLSDAVIAGQVVVDGGFHITALPPSFVPQHPAPLPFALTALGAGQAEAPFASGMWSEASAAIGGSGSGLLGLP